MSAYLNDFTAALRQQILAACPEIAPDGIWEGEHAGQVPWTQLTPPYAAIVFDETEGEEWTADGLVFEFPVDIYYVGLVAGDSSLLRPRLEAIRDDLWKNDAGPGQVTEVSGLSWGRKLEPNRQFEAQCPDRRAGRVTVQVVMGEYQP